ncbi:heterokaryon incompatibility protein-domain-containing protein [Leptodontidium sp. MPI-SDFR-AT-0119]|nr:heterokaryon incompatibility protein-domain-containing protein [Leptodontidium sp. MPI-SDFR-AT-0119]
MYFAMRRSESFEPKSHRNAWLALAVACSALLLPPHHIFSQPSLHFLFLSIYHFFEIMSLNSKGRFQRWLSRHVSVKNTKSAPTRYEHTAFEDETSIRLLYLQPGSFEDDINIKLKVVSLDNPPSYQALSYVWGPPPHDTPVFCHGKELLVSESCVAALRRLRGRYRVNVLWIDAICIDQSSIKERGHQVNLMGDVYSKAQRTWIWLGESTSESDFVMDFLNKYSDVQEKVSSSPPSRQNKDLWREIRKLKKEERMRCGSDSEAESLVKSVTDRSWFERVWTVQEYTLSRDAQALCGGKVIVFSRLLESVQSIATQRMTNGEPTYLPYTSCFQAYQANYRQIWEAIHVNGIERVTFTDLLIEGAQLKASDPKDVVFGLHGIFQKFRVAVPPPDYSKSIEDVLTEATRAAILHDKSLSALLHCSNSRARDSLPSWVPDWSVSERSALRPLPLNMDYFNTSRNSRASFYFPDEDIDLPLSPNLLVVQGVVLDTLTYCAREAFVWENKPEQAKNKNHVREGNTWHFESTAVHEALEAWLSVASKLSPYPTGETIAQALSRTVIVESYRLLGPRVLYPGFDVSKGFSHWLESFRLGSSCVDGDLADDQKASSKIFEEEFLKEIGQEGVEITDTNRKSYVMLSVGRSSDALAFNHLIWLYSRHIRFFTTENGYMGMGMLGIEAGDKVLLIAGLTRPLIARKVGERYRVVGAAYVHGIMDGEKWPADESELVDIVFE